MEAMLRSNFAKPRKIGRWVCFFILVIVFESLSNFQAVKAESTDLHRPTVALALGGGGTRGIAHLSVLRVLIAEGIPIDAIAGTSMGAIVGGLYAAGTPLDKIENAFDTKSIVRAFDTVPLSVRLALVPFFLVPHFFGWHPYDGLYRGGRFAKYLTALAPPDKRKIELINHPKFWAVASNLIDGEPYIIKTGDIGRALQASSAIPALRRPVEHKDALLIDGGITENLPVEAAREMGCDYVIAVDVDQSLDFAEKKHFRKIGSVPTRCLNMGLRALDERQVALADAVINPDVNEIELLSHHESDVRRALRAGDLAARRAIPYIKEQLKQLQAQKDKEALSQN